MSKGYLEFKLKKLQEGKTQAEQAFNSLVSSNNRDYSGIIQAAVKVLRLSDQIETLEQAIE